jgi:DNA-binding LacI/PurR family transcriptional regulator
MGAEAMRLLLKMVAGGTRQVPDVTLPVHLIARAST